MTPSPNPIHVTRGDVISVGRIIAGFFVCVAALSLSITMLVLVIENRNLREAQDCRFDISAEVNTIGDRIDQATARGLSALAVEDEAGVLRQVEIINEQTALLEPAIDRRQNAVEECE
jgi:hypothetical protein